jgi:dTDP-4-dehydrorhamnose reductase
VKSALIIGGNSAIGTALATMLRADAVKVYTTSRRRDTAGKTHLDLAAHPESWPALPQADTAFLCAAITGLDACENDKEATARVNVTHMRALAEKLAQEGMHIVFLSSNQVYDGLKPYREASEPPCPANEYGRQKAAFETWLLARANSASVLRLTKVIAKPLPILASWANALGQGKSVEAFTDLVFAPLPVELALKGMTHLGAARARGIFQLSGTRDVSYRDIAVRLAETSGVDPARIVGTSATDSGIRPQFLPRHGTLRPSDLFTNLPCPEPFDVLGI